MDRQNNPLGILTGEESVKVEHIITVPISTIVTIVAGSLVIGLFTAFAQNIKK